MFAVAIKKETKMQKRERNLQWMRMDGDDGGWPEEAITPHSSGLQIITVTLDERVHHTRIVRSRSFLE